MQAIVSYIGLEVLIAVNMKIAVFLDLTPFSLIETYWGFEGICCLHLIS
jgi:hypothetical protein